MLVKGKVCVPATAIVKKYKADAKRKRRRAAALLRKSRAEKRGIARKTPSPNNWAGWSDARSPKGKVLKPWESDMAKPGLTGQRARPPSLYRTFIIPGAGNRHE